MSIDEFRKFVYYITNKEQSGNTLTPDYFNLLVPRAVEDFFRRKYGLPEEYVQGVPLPRQAWQLTQNITDDLRMLLTPIDLFVDVNGYADLPSNYVHYSSIGYNAITNPETCDGDHKISIRELKIVDDDKWNKLLSHSIKFPTKTYPIARFIGNRIQFMPKDLGKVNMNYLKYPNMPYWGYNIVNDVAVYDSTKSIQFDLPAITHIEISRILLSYIGINLREGDLFTYAETVKEKGI